MEVLVITNRAEASWEDTFLNALFIDAAEVVQFRHRAMLDESVGKTKSCDTG